MTGRSATSSNWPSWKPKRHTPSKAIRCSTLTFVPTTSCSQTSRCGSSIGRTRTPAPPGLMRWALRRVSPCKADPRPSRSSSARWSVRESIRTRSLQRSLRSPAISFTAHSSRRRPAYRPCVPSRRRRVVWRVNGSLPAPVGAERGRSIHDGGVDGGAQLAADRVGR